MLVEGDVRPERGLLRPRNLLCEVRTWASDLVAAREASAVALPSMSAPQAKLTESWFRTGALSMRPASTAYLRGPGLLNQGL